MYEQRPMAKPRVPGESREERRKSALEEIPERDRHPIERQVLAARNEIDRIKGLVREAITMPNGRVMFTFILNDEQKLQWFLTWAVRQATIGRLTPEEAHAYLEEGMALAEKANG